VGGDEDDSVGDREREEPSRPIREASAITEQRKTEGTAGGGEELEDDTESDIGSDIRHDGRMGQGGKPELEGATAIKDEETDTEFGSSTDGRDERHATRPMEGQRASMRAEGPRQGTDGHGRVTPMGGEYEDDGDDDESWQGAREHGWETTAFGKANDGTGKEPEGESESLIGGGEVGNCHDRFGWDAIRAWIGWSERETEGVRGQAGQDSAGRGMAIPRASEDTDMEVGIMECSNEGTVENGKRRNGRKRVMGSLKDQSTDSKGDVGERGEPTEGKHGAERVGNRRAIGEIGSASG
jgi:hypothetical protein